MSREPILILLGILLAISPFVGMPPSWFVFLLPTLGLLVAMIGFTLNQKKKKPISLSHETSPSVDS